MIESTPLYHYGDEQPPVEAQEAMGRQAEEVTAAEAVSADERKLGVLEVVRNTLIRKGLVILEAEIPKEGDESHERGRVTGRTREEVVLRHEVLSTRRGRSRSRKSRLV